MVQLIEEKLFDTHLLFSPKNARRRHVADTNTEARFWAISELSLSFSVYRDSFPYPR